MARVERGSFLIRKISRHRMCLIRMRHSRYLFFPYTAANPGDDGSGHVRRPTHLFPAVA